MATALQPMPKAAEIERVLLDGDLSRLTEEQRLFYYNQVCHSLGLNPLTKPFSYIKLNGRLVLYALKDATEQLRKLHSVSITELTSARLEDVFVVTAKAQDKTGRTDAATGAVAIGTLKGEALANALMKAETKAKRRATLSICGLGMFDESEAESIPQPLVIEAPKLAEAPEVVPVGAFRLLKVESREFGGMVTVVDSEGVEDVFQVPEQDDYQRAEQYIQDAPFLITATRVKSRTAGVKKLKDVKKWVTPDAAPIVAPEGSQTPSGGVVAGVTAADSPFTAF